MSVNCHFRVGNERLYPGCDLPVGMVGMVGIYIYITEDETKSDIADRMVDSSISLGEKSSQAEGSLANPSPPETMVGSCIELGSFAKWREGQVRHQRLFS